MARQNLSFASIDSFTDGFIILIATFTTSADFALSITNQPFIAAKFYP